ncbi:MAG TPA: glycosyltransferase family 2 protein [Gemmatimonadaceae bacterium]|nr:glycosyltransferase family 2 protein [Gemmatimonadaceae bacterium]
MATTARAADPVLSLVIPVFNEEETLNELERRIRSALEPLEAPYEVILVNDGSQDRSAEILRTLAAGDARIKFVNFSRNFGHQAAMYAGLRRAAGQAVVFMDGDLQDPPEVIPRLLQTWREGFEVVHAVRTKRKEGILKRAAYRVYYRLLHRISYIDFTVDSGDFSLMDRRVVDLLASMPERNKFLRGLRTWVGFRQTQLVYERDARFAGVPKYTFAKLLKLALDGMISYSYVPLRLSYVFGLIVAAASFVLGAVYFFQRILSSQPIPQGFTTLAILILFLGGIQLLGMGLLGEYIGRIYDEVKRRPQYVESEVVGFADGRPDAP